VHSQTHNVRMMRFEQMGVAQAEQDPEFESYVMRGIAEAIRRVSDRFEKAKNPQDNLEFHNTDHTEGDVVPRTERILQLLKENGVQVSERDVLIGKLAAAWHDVIQKWEPVATEKNGITKTIRKRALGDNERASAEEVIAYAKEMSEEAQREIFSEEDLQKIRAAIDATIPGFSVANPEAPAEEQAKTVNQPNLKEDSPLVARAVALADLGSAGMGGPESFRRDGDTLFREENLDIMQKLARIHELPNEERESIRARILGWSKFQAEFARGREMLLQKELAPIEPEGAREAVKKLFNQFEASITTARETAARRETLSFEDLVKDIGYSIEYVH